MSLVVDLLSRLATSPYIPPSYLGTILILTLSEHLKCWFLKSQKRNGVNQLYDQIKSLVGGEGGHSEYIDVALNSFFYSCKVFLLLFFSLQI